jgi:hypothetical protein
MLPLGWSCLPSALSLSAAVLLSAVFLALIIQQRRLQRERDALRQEIDVMSVIIQDVTTYLPPGTVDHDCCSNGACVHALRTSRAAPGRSLLDGGWRIPQARAVAGLFPPSSAARKQG